MHDPKLIEAMGNAYDLEEQAISVDDWNTDPAASRARCATAAFTALCTLRPDVAAVLRGEACALPKYPTDAQWDHIAALLDAHPASLLMERQRRWWPDLVAASPYAAKETPDAR